MLTVRRPSFLNLFPLRLVTELVTRIRSYDVSTSPEIMDTSEF